jgi:PhnB protein
MHLKWTDAETKKKNALIRTARVIVRMIAKEEPHMTPSPPTPSIAPWLSVPSAAQAVAFYSAAFIAKETYRLEDSGGGTVVRLSVNGAEFWLSQESEPSSNPEPVGGGSIRMILTVTDPDTVFQRALAAGATEIFPVGEDHGWRLGRFADPFGLHWEVGYQLGV